MVLNPINVPLWCEATSCSASDRVNLRCIDHQMWSLAFGEAIGVQGDLCTTWEMEADGGWQCQ